MKEYSDYYDKCSRLAKSIWVAKRKGLLKKLYSHYNKNLENRELLFLSNKENDRIMHSYKNNSISLYHSISL